jgi:bla regulator protein BlaR1
LLHELDHSKRGDHRVRILELAVGVTYWWLPIVGLVGRQMRACEEACCDAAVISRLPDAGHDYASLLLDVVDFVTPLSVQATAMSP